MRKGRNGILDQRDARSSQWGSRWRTMSSSCSEYTSCFQYAMYVSGRRVRRWAMTCSGRERMNHSDYQPAGATPRSTRRRRNQCGGPSNPRLATIPRNRLPLRRSGAARRRTRARAHRWKAGAHRRQGSVRCSWPPSRAGRPRRVKSHQWMLDEAQGRWPREVTQRPSPRPDPSRRRKDAWTGCPAGEARGGRVSFAKAPNRRVRALSGGSAPAGAATRAEAHLLRQSDRGRQVPAHNFRVERSRGSCPS